MKRLIAGLVLAFLSVFGSAGSAHAGSLSIQGLAITPDIMQVTLDNRPSLNYQIRLDNNLTTPITVSVTTLDFKSLNDTGGLAFIGSGASSLEHRYGLAKWIDIPTTPITLAPETGQFISVTVENRSDLSLGGHYAAIIFKIKNGSANGANNVQLNQEVSSLLFVRKAGGTYALPLTKAGFNNTLFKWPSVLSLTFANSGDTQTAPTGYIDLAGQRKILNENANLVLPGNSRLFSVSLPRGSGFWPGRYHAIIHYRPDAISQFSSFNASFFYVNPWFVIFCLLVLVFVFIAIRPARSLLFWTLLKLDRQLRKLEVYSTHFGRAMRRPKIIIPALGRFVVWLLLKLDRQIRRLEIWLTKLARLLRQK